MSGSIRRPKAGPVLAGTLVRAAWKGENGSWLVGGRPPPSYALVRSLDSHDDGRYSTRQRWRSSRALNALAWFRMAPRLASTAGSRSSARAPYRRDRQRPQSRSATSRDARNCSKPIPHRSPRRPVLANEDCLDGRSRRAPSDWRPHSRWGLQSCSRRRTRPCTAPNIPPILSSTPWSSPSCFGTKGRGRPLRAERKLRGRHGGSRKSGQSGCSKNLSVPPNRTPCAPCRPRSRCRMRPLDPSPLPTRRCPRRIPMRGARPIRSHRRPRADRERSESLR